MNCIRNSFFIWAGSLLLLSACGNSMQNTGSGTKATAVANDFPEEKLGWHLGAQAYTFKSFTFFEALDKIDSCGLRYVEAYPGQAIGGGIEGKMDFTMDEQTRAAILDRLREKNIKLYAYGVISPDTEEDWRKLFAFAKAMGIQTITSEPKPPFLSLVSDLCDEFGINLAIHNHPTPSAYWNPSTVLEAVKGRSARMGSCADIGHWLRSGLDPLECLRLLEGRVLHSHMKDLNVKGDKKAHDVHWGQGVSDIPAIIGELKRQNFKGMISVEYEYNWENSVPDVTESVKFFRNTLRQ